MKKRASMETHSLDLMVERQIQKWQKQSTTSKIARRPTTHPIITVSRQHGAQGTALGRLLARRLDFNFWDREMLFAMAEHAHVSEKLLESLDEHPKDLIADMARTFANSKNPGSREYMRELFRQVLAIAHHGRAVVMGRGAQLMVAHNAAFRVRVVAPLEFRIAQVMSEKAISKSAAQAEIARIDAEYAGFIRENWSTDIDKLSLYDLILNTQDLGVEGAATTIISAYRERFAQVIAA